MSNDSLGIAQIGFLVRAMIDRAPSWTMLRELVMNAIEAARQASGEKLVRVTSRNYNGIPKLVIWNTGPGLSDSELVEVTQLSSSVNKTLDLDANFGVGAKVSSLANNRAGMIYRSCKEGSVSEVILAFDEDGQNYVRLMRDIGGERLSVIDVTEAVRANGVDVSSGWTEVMLLGNALDQNTVEVPLALEGNTNKDFVATALYWRFYRVPDDVAIKVDGVFTRFGSGSARRFEAIRDRRTKSFTQYEAVRSDGHGATVHFYHDTENKGSSSMRASAGGALGSTTTTLCLVHKDEMYVVKTGVPWSAAAPAFGIPFGSKELCVHVELDDNLARPSQYRERLIRRDNGADVTAEQFAHVVRGVMPDWVRAVVAVASPERPADHDDLRRELQSLMDELKLKSEGRRRSDDGGLSDEDDAGEPLGQGDGRRGRSPLRGRGPSDDPQRVRGAGGRHPYKVPRSPRQGARDHHVDGGRGGAG